MTQPHDNLFKDVFGDPEVAAEHLRGALPAEVLAWVDLDTLERVERSFVDGELGEQHADLLFTVRLKSGGEALVYLLFEHPTASEPMVPYRLMVYFLRIWAHWFETHPNAKRLPRVYPLVLHDGQRAWTTPLKQTDLIDLPEEVAEIFAEALFHLSDDRTGLSHDEDLTPEVLLAEVKILMEHAWDKDVLDSLPGWLVAFHQAVVEARRRPIEISARFLFQVSNDERIVEVLQQMVAEVLGPGNEEYIMSLVDNWRAEGFEKGFEQGREQGIEQGRRQQAKELLVRLLERRYGSLSSDARERVEQADLDTLTTWTERIFTAESVDALLRR
ncbi:MAG: Rpn family recombination-promoting nuclease/putative transposase [Alphaproteobacteria bacterium]|nr:Rpn family recombination-promoting nuclease/putative transposase [Alphaproteobacteria bacterium]